MLRQPHVAQLDVLRGARRFNVVACGRRWGKTELAVEYLVPRCLVKRRQPAGWFAPTYRLLEEAWDRVADALRRVYGPIDVNKADRQMTVDGGLHVDFWTLSGAKEGESLAGRGRAYGLVVIDEAAHAKYLDQDWTRAIRPTLTDYRGEAWMLSTPRGRNAFHRLWLRGRMGEVGWASFQQPTSANPFLAADEITAAEAELPRAAFAQEYLAEFLADAANPFGLEAIAACLAPILSDAEPVCWGVDLAKSTDWTVAIALDARMHVCGYQRWQADWRNTTSRLQAMLGRTPALVDSTGVGDPIVEELQARCTAVEGFKFSSQSKQQLMEGLAVALQRHEVRFPDVPPVRDELEAFGYEYRPTGVRYCAPEGVHDDCVDALALAVMCYRRRPAAATLDASGPEDLDWTAAADPVLARMNDERIWTDA